VVDEKHNCIPNSTSCRIAGKFFALNSEYWKMVRLAKKNETGSYEEKNKVNRKLDGRGQEDLKCPLILWKIFEELASYLK
jgi:hypothetical protein